MITVPYLDKRLKPVRTDWFLDEVAEMIRDALAADDNFQYAEVFTEQERPEKPLNVEPPYVRVILMYPRTIYPAIASEASPIRQRRLPFLVLTEVAHDPEQGGGWNYITAAEEVHEKIYGVISNESVSDSRHTAVFPVHRCTDPKTPEWDDDMGGWVQSVEYATVLRRAA